MKEPLALGAALVLVSAVHLVPAILTGEIPANWPVKPLTKAAKPLQYKITFAVMLFFGTLGVAIMVFALLGGEAVR